MKDIPKDKKPKPTRLIGACSSCGGHFTDKTWISDFGYHDGWEMPPYEEIICPVCVDGGCIDDFFTLEESDYNG